VYEVMRRWTAGGVNVQGGGFKSKVHENIFRCLLKLDFQLQSKVSAGKPFYTTGAEYEKVRL